MQQQKYITIGKAAKELGVSVCTLRRWDRCGKLRSAFRTLGKHRRYLVLDILKLKKTNQRLILVMQEFQVMTKRKIYKLKLRF